MRGCQQTETMATVSLHIMLAYFMLRRTIVCSLSLSFLFRGETSVLEFMKQITALCGLMGLSCRDIFPESQFSQRDQDDRTSSGMPLVFTVGLPVGPS